jgi:hypothetical protein
MAPKKSLINLLFVFKTVWIFIFICQSASFFVVSANCQTETGFTPADTFEIPSNNSFVHFSTNGSFVNAFLENNTWFFNGLYFDFDFYSAQKLNISVSGRDCNMTINPFFVFSRSSQGDGVSRLFFSYSVEGDGIQSVNLGFNLQQGKLEAILDGEWIGLNHGWTRSSDGTVTVTAQVSNVTISFYGHPESYLDEPDLFEDHYVVISSTFSLVVIVVLATVIRRNKRNGETK